MAKVREVYERREVTFPVESVINQAFGAAGADNVFALQQIVGWANSKYNLGWKTEDLGGKDVPSIADDLVRVTKDFIHNGKLDREIDAALALYGASANGELVDWAKKRFGQALNAESLASPDSDPREVLRQAGRELARWELTQLERYVLLRIYDQGWKDHLLEMDHLKHAIMQRPLGGDQTHPQSQYAIEGRDQFQQMWKTIRDRVTDMIFKVSVAAPEPTAGTTNVQPDPGGLLSQAQTQHAEATGAGFAGAAADEQAAMRAQGEGGGKAATIRREEPKVGRNDPCPCGSGKKYKQCHGKRA